MITEPNKDIHERLGQKCRRLRVIRQKELGFMAMKDTDSDRCRSILKYLKWS